MALPSHKQEYVLLRALAGLSSPVGISQLVAEMKLVNGRIGGGVDAFVFGPVSLSKVLDEQQEDGDVLFRHDRGYSITERGRRSVRVLEEQILK